MILICETRWLKCWENWHTNCWSYMLSLPKQGWRSPHGSYHSIPIIFPWNLRKSASKGPIKKPNETSNYKDTNTSQYNNSTRKMKTIKRTQTFKTTKILRHPFDNVPPEMPSLHPPIKLPGPSSSTWNGNKSLYSSLDTDWWPPLKRIFTFR